QPFGTALGQLQPDIAAPRMPEHEDLVLRLVAPEPAGQLFGIEHELLGRHRRRDQLRIVQQIGLAAAALIPVHDGEVLLQRTRVPPRQRQLEKTGAAMQDQQHRVTAIAAADGYELFDATNANRLVPLDALRRDDTTQVTDDARGLRARE